MFCKRQVSAALLALGVSSLVITGPLLAWSFEGHRSITRRSIAMLGPEVPLDRTQIEIAAEGSVFPDLSRPVPLAELRDRENPQHFINLELLGDRPLPPTRSAYIRAVSTLAASPDLPLGGRWTMSSIGTLPYALTEATQQLAAIFRQLRSDPGNSRLQWLALHYTGVLAHYSADLCQPLHTSIHYNGRARPDGRSSDSGIHDKIDRLIEASRIGDQTSAKAPVVEEYEDVFIAVVAELMRSTSLVDRVYELETDIWNASASREASGELEAFVTERFSAATRFTANLIQTAWKISETLELPVERESLPTDSDPDRPQRR